MMGQTLQHQVDHFNVVDLEFELLQLALLVEHLGQVQVHITTQPNDMFSNSDRNRRILCARNTASFFVSYTSHRVSHISEPVLASRSWAATDGGTDMSIVEKILFSEEIGHGTLVRIPILAISVLGEAFSCMGFSASAAVMPTLCTSLASTVGVYGCADVWHALFSTTSDWETSSMLEMRRLKGIPHEIRQRNWEFDHVLLCATGAVDEHSLQRAGHVDIEFANLIVDAVPHFMNGRRQHSLIQTGLDGLRDHCAAVFNLFTLYLSRTLVINKAVLYPLGHIDGCTTSFEVTFGAKE
ncbi:hypothetical protein PsorP6_014626 [Peronosclerospora sorghi]|uniref:Uncharacterized protein n=1 Tax=Peronosclerospora sorghi TaxID=230839 RepID=A0ACC0VSV2_9STRA|nr:hypothetical protein PsorP6_014626 [Peronosclerospora sorghi]